MSPSNDNLGLSHRNSSIMKKATSFRENSKSSMHGYKDDEPSPADSSTSHRNQQRQQDSNGPPVKTTTTTTTPTATATGPSRVKKTAAASLRGAMAGPLKRFRSRHFGGGAASAAASQQQRRRANSAPARLLRNRRNRPPRHRLLEDHYRVDDADKRVVLPGVPSYEEDWARDSHDFFNLVVLLPVVYLNGINWDWDRMWRNLQRQFLVHQQQQSSSHHHHHHHAAAPASFANGGLGAIQFLADAWTGEWFDLFFQVTCLYFLVDLCWVMCVPSCVKSPATIIQHHIATILYILIPYYHPECRWCMGACMLVEINTWFLIARRVFNKQGFPPWIIQFSFVSIRIKLISTFFYITWIAIRCLLYPALMRPFVQIWMAHSVVVGTRWNLVALCIPLHAAFCLLNWKWSYDLLMSKIRYWRRILQKQSQNGTAAVNHQSKDYDNSVSKGL